MNTCPQDVAKLTFYQFIKSPLGSDLMVMLCLGGQPNPAQWDVHSRWWLRQREEMDNKLKTRGDAPDWPIYVTWRAKLFMSIFLETQKIMVINITMVPLEKLIWNFTAMRNILVDLALVVEEDLVKPVTYFQKLAKMGNYNPID